MKKNVRILLSIFGGLSTWLSGRAHLRLFHTRCSHLWGASHHTLRCSWRPDVISTLFLAPFQILLVLNLFFDILIPLQNAVVLNFPLLQPLVHSQLKAFLMSCHFIGLFLHQFRLRSEDLFVTRVVVLLSLLLFKFMNAALYLMCFLIVLLLGQVLLDTLKI